jgi:hypothetical protein
MAATTHPCTWLVERRNPAFDNPDWYPDSPADVNVIVECGAPATDDEDGGFHCKAGHRRSPRDADPGGFDFQMEQAERMGEQF